MRSIQIPRGTSGFALAEVLVALLLLAIAMLGSGAALIETIAGQRAALLQTRAADLASNLAEALRAAPDAEAAAVEIETWRVAVVAQLPAAEPLAAPRGSPSSAPPASALPASFDIRLRWRDGRARSASQLSLPLAFHVAAGSP